MPPLTGATGIPPLDAWIAEAIGLYQREVTIRAGEHACMDDLRKAGVIQ